MKYKFYKSKHGSHIAKIEPNEFKEFGSWLESDVQNSEPIANIILQDIKNIQSGTIDKKEIVGNSMVLTLSKNGAIVQNSAVFDEASGFTELDYPQSDSLNLTTLRNLIIEWIEYRIKSI